MNSKITSYVEVLFKDVPNTKKARELKEEILSTLNDHFEAHIAEGKSENQAYTEALCDLGDVDELLQELVPEKELKEKIDAYRQKRARNTAIAVPLYIISVAVLIAAGTLGEHLFPQYQKLIWLIGISLTIILIAIATGIVIYTNMSLPQDVADYISRDRTSRKIEYDGQNKVLSFLAAFMDAYWGIVLVVYFLTSFLTNKWGITWLIWIIAIPLEEALYSFFNTDKKELKSFKKENKKENEK